MDPWEALNIHIIPTKVARVVPEEAITVTRRMPPVSCPGLGSVGSETSAELFPCRKLELLKHSRVTGRWAARWAHHS